MSEIIDIPKPKQQFAEITLPCGYTSEDGILHKEVTIREITGNEEDILASEKIRPSIKSNRLLSGCIKKIGTFDKPEDISNIVLELLSTDRYFILIQLRILSLGNLFSMEIPCPHCGDTTNKIRTIDLTKITFTPPSDLSKKVFSGILPRSGRQYKWQRLNGKLEGRIDNNLINDDSILSLMIFQRLIELDDKPLNNIKNDLSLIKTLPLIDRTHLRAEFKKNEGEVDDKIIVTCSLCGNEFSRDIDIASKDFFFP